MSGLPVTDRMTGAFFQRVGTMGHMPAGPKALLHMTQELGRLFGQLLENAAGRAERSDSRPRRPPPDQLQAAQEPPVAVSSALRDLGEAVATVAGAMERQPVGGEAEGSPELLRELAANIGRLDWLLEGPAERRDAGSLPQASKPVAKGIPTGLTLKAVSKRTGIPAATLRTWERRHGFLRLVRSASGYRLYGEPEIAQILQVKYLLGEGVRSPRWWRWWRRWGPTGPRSPTAPRRCRPGAR
jgi:MerR HTH family regulatory protein